MIKKINTLLIKNRELMNAQLKRANNWSNSLLKEREEKLSLETYEIRKRIITSGIINYPEYPLIY